MAQIDAKTKKKIMAGREMISNYRNTHSQVTDSKEHTKIQTQLLVDLKDGGFASIDDFFAKNQQLCEQELARCYQLIGQCDGCLGRKRGCIQSCYENRAELLSAFVDRKPPATFDNAKIVIKVIRKPLVAHNRDFFDWQRFDGHSPPECAIHFEKIAEPQFDVSWNMPEGFTPDNYQEIKSREQ